MADSRPTEPNYVTVLAYESLIPPATSSLESGRRQVQEAAQRMHPQRIPWKALGKPRCERAHKGSIDADAGLPVPCNPASSLERATGIAPATSSLGSWVGDDPP